MSSESDGRQRETAAGPEGDQEQLRLAGLKHLAAQQAGVPCGPDCDCRKRDVREAFGYGDQQSEGSGEGQATNGLPRRPHRPNLYELGWAERRRLAREEAEAACPGSVDAGELRLQRLAGELGSAVDVALMGVLQDMAVPAAIGWRIRALTRLDVLLEAIRAAAGAAGGTVHCLLEDERDALRVNASAERGRLG